MLEVLGLRRFESIFIVFIIHFKISVQFRNSLAPAFRKMIKKYIYLTKCANFIMCEKIFVFSFSFSPILLLKENSMQI